MMDRHNPDDRLRVYCRMVSRPYARELVAFERGEIDELSRPPEVALMRLGPPHQIPEVREVGRARLVDGRVQLTGESAVAIEARVWHPDDLNTPPTPTDGVRFLLGLPWAFHGAYFWATLVEPEPDMAAHVDS